MKWGVRYEVFALNGILAVIGFIATSSFMLGLGVFGVVHLVSAYLCQRDPYIFHIFERRISKRERWRTSLSGGRGAIRHEPRC
ncbi:hypothetical protein AJ88_35730 [Mesorhizobium amorphae CCBAU 01583]|nr:hypothetical protein AJ88_35730 [Mesorhizobium amorphae CCBAU 01583]